MAEGGQNEAYVTLATNNQYAYGALALGQSLVNTGTQRKRVVMITAGVSEDMRQHLQRVWSEVKIIEEMNSGDEESLALIQRPELGITFSKLQAWRLEEYSKCVFLDADTLVLTNVDDLFEREELSAAPDIGWPDLFNTGVFVFKPSYETFCSLVELAKTEGSYDGGDQGLLNTFWSTWSVGDSRHRLPFLYNVVANLTYSYPPAFKRFSKDIKIIHFLGSVKPWHHCYIAGEDRVILCPGTNTSQYGALEYILQWWQVYNSSWPPGTSEIPEPVSIDTIPDIVFTPSDEDRRASWERGHPDYHGVDQSDNIIDFIHSQLTK